MKLKELIEKTNIELKTIFDKPVIREGYNGYNIKDGRSVITQPDLINIMRKLTNNKYNFSYEKFDIQIGNVTFKIKRKKSDITSSWQHTNQMTITEIYLSDNEDQEILEKTLEEIFITYKEEKDNAQQEEVLRRKQNRDNFINNLNKYGMTVEDFENMQLQYKKLTYSELMRIKEK